MSIMPFEWSWKVFSGGVTDNPNEAPQGRYYNGYNMSTKGYYAFPRQINTTLYTYEDVPNALFNQSVIGKNSNMVWLDNGKIYNNGTLKATLSTFKQGFRIGHMKVGEERLYYFPYTIPSATPIAIHRSKADGNDLEEAHLTYTSNEGNPLSSPPNGMQVISEGIRILFTHYNLIFEMSNTEVISKLVTFPSNENVVAITKFLGEYKIYTTIGFTGSKIYTWDGVDEAPILLNEMPGIPLLSVVQNKDYDLGTTLNGSIYQITAPQYFELYNRIGFTALKNIDGKIYGNYTNKDSKKSIGVFGNNPGYPLSLSSEYSINPSNTTIGLDGGDIDFDDTTIYYLDKGSKTLKSLAGTAGNITSYIESMIFDGQKNNKLEKIPQSLILHFSNTTATCFIKVEAQINENGTRIELYTGNNTAIAAINGINQGITIPMQVFNEKTMGKFNSIKFRVSFVGNGSVNGRFYGLTLYGNMNVGPL